MAAVSMPADNDTSPKVASSVSGSGFLELPLKGADGGVSLPFGTFGNIDIALGFGFGGSSRSLATEPFASGADSNAWDFALSGLGDGAGR
eukprot:m.16561 g.16561  ORF g.16561 m.16561 type:complete len:90 (+) comp27014_c0_seq3:344-613(+)